MLCQNITRKNYCHDAELFGILPILSYCFFILFKLYLIVVLFLLDFVADSTPSAFYVRLVLHGSSLASGGSTSSTTASSTSSAIGEGGHIRTPRVKCSGERIARKVGAKLRLKYM